MLTWLWCNGSILVPQCEKKDQKYLDFKRNFSDVWHYMVRLTVWMSPIKYCLQVKKMVTYRLTVTMPSSVNRKTLSKLTKINDLSLVTRQSLSYSMAHAGSTKPYDSHFTVVNSSVSEWWLTSGYGQSVNWTIHSSSLHQFRLFDS